MTKARSARRLAATPAGSLLLALVLTSLVGQALTVPSIARLAGLPAVRLLDYSRQVGTLAPLTDAFVRRTLGLAPLIVAPEATASVALQGPIPGGPETGTSGGPADAPVTATHAFSNDDFEHAYAVRGLPFTANTDTTGQSRQSGEPASCSATGGTAWYRYTPSRDQTLFADTFGTSYADAVGIFTGSSVDALQQVGCASSPTGEAQTGFAARRGTTYWFQIGGTVSGGHLVFHLLPIGTTQRLSTRVDKDPAVSGDGRYIAFPGTPSGPEPGARACHVNPWCQALYLADVRTGQVRILLSLHPAVTPDANDVERSRSSEPALSEVTISADGRYIGFGSDDPELVAGDNNGVPDVFVFDRVSGRVEPESVTSNGKQTQFDPVMHATGPCADGVVDGSFYPSLSATGRFVAFESNAANLGPPNPSGCPRVFLRDRLARRTELASVTSSGQSMTGVLISSSSVSADGRYVVFVNGGQLHVYDRRAHVSDRVAGAGAARSAAISADGSRVAFLYIEGSSTIFVTKQGLAVADLRTGRITRVDGVSDAPQSGTVSAPFSGTSAFPTVSISATGRYVAYASNNANVVAGDSNGVQDVFVYDTDARASVRVSVNSTGSQYTVASGFPSISGDGRTVAFVQGGAAPSSDVPGSDAVVLVHHSVRAGAP